MSAIPHAATKAPIELRGVRKSFGGLDVVHGLDLRVEGGEFVVFVGPSGCGKSTLLRMIAGLEDVTDGDILIAGRDVTDVDPAQRGIAMVFQSYALYPHMTVRENLAFGLEIARTPKVEMERQITAVAETLRLSPLLARRPGQLSGGQRQRVAIGRAIVRKPLAFLFDEPLSNLDAELRVEMRIEIARLHRELGSTMIFVTHDQTEAMTLADRIVVLKDGRIEQVGTPKEIYENPDNLFVAGFIGSPRMNILDARRAGDGMLEVGGSRLAAPFDLGGDANAVIKVGFRPEAVDVRRAGSEPSVGSEPDVGSKPGAGIRARVDFVEYLGSNRFIYAISEAGPTIVIEQKGGGDVQPDDTIDCRIDPARFHVFDANGRRIGGNRGRPA
jgi:lactose/L-arabinose transport system ATP-binding protein